MRSPRTFSTIPSAYVSSLFAAAITLASLSDQAQAQYVGVTVGYQYSAQLTGPPTYPNQFNISMYNPNGGSQYDPNNPTWGVWAEQLEQAGVDFICPNLTGSWPQTNNPPQQMVGMINAINNRGLGNTIKFAIFDDNAASWTAQWNQANGRGFGYAQPFDISNSNNWVYLWDYNYRRFYQTVPDANRFKINNRPVIMIWTGNPFFVANEQGNLSRALTYVRQRAQAEFGFNPYIVVNEDMVQQDSTCNNPAIIDATHRWFGPPSDPYTLSTFNNVKVGVAVPEFQHPGQNGFLDPNHGALFRNGLNQTVKAGALLTLCEGFTDYEEDAAMWRVRNISPSGGTLGYNQTMYDFPNQRIGILREFSRNPFPSQMKFEAEGCDTFGGAAGGNGLANFYRNGNIAIQTTTDTLGGFNVGWMQNGEWLEWQRVPLNGTPRFQVRIATPNTGARVHLVVNGVAQPIVNLPNTGGWQTWTTVDLGTAGTFNNSYNTVRIVFDTGGVNFNWWQYTGSSSTGVTFYADTNYGGAASQALPVGNYTLAQLAARGVPNDWASSVRVPSGRTVIMYSDDNFSGTSWTRTADTPNFTTLSPNANDMVSSVRVQ
jgi:hypothetical protein